MLFISISTISIITFSIGFLIFFFFCLSKLFSASVVLMNSPTLNWISKVYCILLYCSFLCCTESEFSCPCFTTLNSDYFRLGTAWQCAILQPTCGEENIGTISPLPNAKGKNKTITSACHEGYIAIRNYGKILGNQWLLPEY